MKLRGILLTLTFITLFSGATFAQKKTIVLVRHVEKDISATADKTDPELSQAGRDRSLLMVKAVALRVLHVATCPTYQLLGDELDGPRGRIYLIKQVLEGDRATGKTRLHLDRCLTCRSCETTCPSGVQSAGWPTSAATSSNSRCRGPGPTS